MIKILGVSASLRNARYGSGVLSLLSEIRNLTSQSDLIRYIKDQENIHLENFFEAGRNEALPFDEIYYRLKKLKGDRGLSNSEAALVAALWGAYQSGVEIDHLSLVNHFLPTGKIVRKEELKEKILAMDALLISTPVYFGDRSSLSQSFIEFLHADAELRSHIEGKVYAGVTVGAKRNGGQETTLIYQIIDMVNLKMLAVGNDAATTSQYGGTAVAGDVGTLGGDSYGLDTCIGTGRRIANVAKLFRSKKCNSLKTITVDLWLLQDESNKKGYAIYKDWIQRLSDLYEDKVNFRLWDFTEELITRCIACDICPISRGDKKQYRCIISKHNDLFKREHAELLNTDAILICAYSPKDRSNINSVYQKFIERTRYLRRDDYLFHNLLVAPFVVSEVSANQNLHIRMLTSMIRHNTILHQPLIGFEYKKNILNFDELLANGQSFVDMAIQSKYPSEYSDSKEAATYNPIGYIISKLEKDLKCMT